MKRIIYLATLLTLAACSSDDVVEQSDSSTITYEVTTNNATRSDAHTPYTDEVGFAVSAIYSSETDLDKFFVNDIVTYDTDNSTYKYTYGKRLWPQEQDASLDFYAVHDDTSGGMFTDYTPTLKVIDDENSSLNGKVAMTLSGYKTKSSVVGANASDDLMYAVTKNQKQSTNSGKVSLNFRHALSRVEFIVRNSSASGLIVELSNITLCCLHMAGDLTFGTVTTPQILYSDDYSSDACEWTVTDTDATAATQSMSMFDVALDNYSGNNENGFILAPGGTTSNTTFLTSFMVIPQVFSAGAHDDSGWSGTYVKLRCRVYNLLSSPAEYVGKVGLSFYDWDNWVITSDKFATAHNSTRNICLPLYTGDTVVDNNGDDDEDWVEFYIPLTAIETVVETEDYSKEIVNIGWEHGKHYRYTISFGSDYTTDNPGTDKDGNPVLMNVEFNLSNDTWTGSEDINSDTDMSGEIH